MRSKEAGETAAVAESKPNEWRYMNNVNQ